MFWKPFNLAIFSVPEPTQKQFMSLLIRATFKLRIALELVKIIALKLLKFIGS